MLKMVIMALRPMITAMVKMVIMVLMALRDMIMTMVKMVLVVLMALRDMVTAIMQSKSRSSLILKNEAVCFRPKVLHLLELLKTKKVQNKRKRLTFNILPTVSSQTSSASSWLSIWVVSMPGLSSFLFSTISAHITYNFCFMCCRRWYRLHRVPQSSQTEKFCGKFQNEIHKLKNDLVRVCCAKSMADEINSRQANQ